MVVVATATRLLAAGQLTPGTWIKDVHEQSQDHEHHCDGEAAVIAVPSALLLLRHTSANCERIKTINNWGRIILLVLFKRVTLNILKRWNGLCD